MPPPAGSPHRRAWAIPPHLRCSWGGACSRLHSGSRCSASLRPGVGKDLAVWSRSEATCSSKRRSLWMAESRSSSSGSTCGSGRRWRDSSTWSVGGAIIREEDACRDCRNDVRQGSVSSIHNTVGTHSRRGSAGRENEDVRAGTAATPALDLQRQQDLGCQAKPAHPCPGAVYWPP
jgi:hypothetical protein